MFIVPPLSKDYYVIASRALWMFSMMISILLLIIYGLRERRLMFCEVFEEVVLFFTSLIAMETSQMKIKLLNKKRVVSNDCHTARSDTDNDFN